MREILFKGKRKDNGEWVEGHLLWNENGRARIIPRHTDIFCYENDENTIQTIAYEVISETVGQYTCLTDKNGKKIFEGDIVKGKFGTGMVNYNNGCFCVKGYPYKSYFNNPAIDVVMSEDCIEIIGNIHDNPELLKEADDE